MLTVLLIAGPSPFGCCCQRFKALPFAKIKISKRRQMTYRFAVNWEKFDLTILKCLNQAPFY